ncbi:MAG: hypothetical protein QGI93_00690, partial [Planctomycetota bacterium]|nr:hypothetical protein [Planctomycetota bacterium]
RLQKLMRDGKISEEDSPYGLPKVRAFVKVKVKKKAPVEEAGDATEEGAEGAEASEAEASEE